MLWTQALTVLSLGGALLTSAAPAAPAAQCANVTEGIMLGSGSFKSLKTADVAACCAACQAADTCVAFTFDGSISSRGRLGGEATPSSCFLKTNSQNTGACNHHGKQTTCTSGVVPGRKPSPSPPPGPAPPGSTGYNTACATPGDAAKWPFCDMTLTHEQRLADLVVRINASEMGKQLTARESSALGRLGIPAYYWGTNALHAFREAPCVTGADGRKHCPTSFPTPPNYGAAFNRSLSAAMGRSFGTELRAMYNVRAVHSLDTWSPTINLARDPRWGRTDETPSEDPYVLGQHALHNVLGAQNGPEPSIPMIGVTLKHWIANNVEGGVGHYSRHTIDANISAYDLASSYMPGYETPIKHGNALGIMCSYNSVNGKPTCANSELLNVLRGDWGFEGYITSDSDACGDIYSSHHYAKDPVHAAAACLLGGTDINSGGTYGKNLEAGVASGVISLASARQALTNAYGFRMRLGLFDHNITDKNRLIPVEAIGALEHHQASLDTARQSLILLKNDVARGLPFAAGRRLVVLGNDFDQVSAIMKPDNYNANNICPDSAAREQLGKGLDTSCLSSIWETLNKTNAAAGGSSAMLAAPKGGWTPASIAAAVALAKTAQNLIVVISDAQDEGGESHDRASIALAADQMRLAKAVFAAVAGKAGVRATLMTITGGVIGFDELREVPPSIIDIKMPGAYGAQAVAETVWGANVPSGKLPFTVYFSNYTDGLSIDDMSMQAGQGRTYRYFDGPVVYPFGHGISYTTFSLAWSPTPPPAAVFRAAADSTTYHVLVKNTGATYAADEVVLAFFKPHARSIPSLRGSGTPIVLKQLFGFEKVHLVPGASTTLQFTVNATALALVDGEGHTSLHGGQYDIVFSRGCVGCAELSARATIATPTEQPLRLKTFRKWW